MKIFSEVNPTTVASIKGIVNHGTTGTTARPTGYTSIEWIGSATPVNAVDGDTWVNTAASSGSGTLSAQPAATAVPGGYMYFATDDNGGTLYRSDGSTWTKVSPSLTQSGGGELGYAEITSNFVATPSANTFVDITGLTTTVTVGTRPIFIQVGIADVLSNVAADDITVAILEDGSIIQAAAMRIDTINTRALVQPIARRAPSAGTHTYKAQIKCQTASTTITLEANAAYAAFIRVTEG